jgi:hypothetical protein
MGIAAETWRLMLSDPMYSGAIKVVAEMGNAPGHTIRMNRPKFTDTTYTTAAREVGSGTAISTVPLDVASEQVAITVKRYAGPYDQTNSRVAPFGIDRFDASRSIHKLANWIGLQLQRDLDKWLDKVTIGLIDGVVSGNTLWPNGFTQDSDMKAAGDAPMDFDMLARAESTLDAANIPRFPNGRRICVLHPRQIQQLKNDGQFVKYVEYYKEKNPMFTSYLGTAGNLDIFSSSNLTTQAGPPVIYQGQVFGPGMVGWGVGEAPRVAHSTDDNFGEQAKLIWVWYAGAVCLDNRFGISLHTD